MCACVRTCVCERGGGVKVDDACMYIIKRGRGWGGEGREGGKGGREGGREGGCTQNSDCVGRSESIPTSYCRSDSYHRLQA